MSAQRITFVLDGLFTPESRALSDEVLGFLLRNLTAANILWLKEHPEAPMLYDSGVRYQEEPPGSEDWCNIPMVLKLGWGDCEDLACWRAAELRVRAGIAAEPIFTKHSQADGSMLYHITVKLPDGRTEDPSRQLGMR